MAVDYAPVGDLGLQLFEELKILVEIKRLFKQQNVVANVFWTVLPLQKLFNVNYPFAFRVSRIRLDVSETLLIPSVDHGSSVR